MAHYIIVRLNDKNRRIGQGHHRARLSDADVDLMRDLHELNGKPYRELAGQFRVSFWTVRAICQYRRRAQTVVMVKAVMVKKVDDGSEK